MYSFLKKLFFTVQNKTKPYSEIELAPGERVKYKESQPSLARQRAIKKANRPFYFWEYWLGPKTSIINAGKLSIIHNDIRRLRRRITDGNITSTKVIIEQLVNIEFVITRKKPESHFKTHQ